MERQQNPDCLHLTVMSRHFTRKEALINDLKEGTGWTKSNSHPDSCCVYQGPPRIRLRKQGLLCDVRNGCQDPEPGSRPPIFTDFDVAHVLAKPHPLKILESNSKPPKLRTKINSVSFLTSRYFMTREKASRVCWEMQLFEKWSVLPLKVVLILPPWKAQWTKNNRKLVVDSSSMKITVNCLYMKLKNFSSMELLLRNNAESNINIKERKKSNSRANFKGN